MKKQYITLILVFFIISCSNQSKDKQLTGIQIERTDTFQKEILVDSSKVLQFNCVISERFSQLALYLDTIGYSFDTLRLNKTYTLLKKSSRLNIKNHYFYNYKLQETVPFRMIYQDSSYFEDQINIEVLKKTQSVIAYFFSKRTPDIKYGKKWYIDGVAEEWKFPNNNSAKTAAIELSSIVESVYFNVSAFICYVDNYMYVFSSRSSAYMNSINPIFKKFALNNKATITTK